jgi:hypothetical protein
VTVFLYDGGIVPDLQRIITGGHDNKTARTVAIRRGEKLNAPASSDVRADHRQQPGRRLAKAEGSAAREAPPAPYVAQPRCLGGTLT